MRLIIGAVLLSFCHGKAKVPDTLKNAQGATTEFLPILTYDTDVGLGYGVKVFALDHLGVDESFDMVLFNSTKGERWYRLVFAIPDFERRQGTEYPIALEVVFDYDKWIKNSFFGIGNTSQYSTREYYTKEPFEISTAISRGITPNAVGLFGIRYKTIRNYNFSAGGRLIALAPAPNAATAHYVSLFLCLRYDTRNSYVNASRGLVLQGETELAPRSGLNNVAFTRFGASLQHYSPCLVQKSVLALRFTVQGIIGDNLPVQVLLPVGGNNTLRGFPQDRFLDKASMIGNMEFRFPIYWRFGGVVGLDAGKVWRHVSELNIDHWAINGVAGLRFSMDTFIVRLDVGMSKETTGFYLNFGQIF